MNYLLQCLKSSVRLSFKKVHLLLIFCLKYLYFDFQNYDKIILQGKSNLVRV